MKKICYLNLKGGCGKTTSVINIGGYLALQGKRILLIDCDLQSNLTRSLIESDIGRATIYDLLIGDVEMNDVVVNVKENIDLIPSSLKMMMCDTVLNEYNDKEFILSKHLKCVKEEYDYVLIDCPPSYGISTLNALLSSDEVYVPVQAEYYSVDGIYLIQKMFGLINEKFNTSIDITGLFATMLDKRNKLCNIQYENLKVNFKDLFLKSAIRKNISLAESPVFNMSIFEYKPSSHGALDYRSLIEEIQHRGGM